MSRIGVVGREQVTPPAVSELGRPLRRADDVGEEHSREDTVGLRRRPRAGEELFNLVGNRVRVPGRDPVVGARELDELRARDP